MSSPPGSGPEMLTKRTPLQERLSPTLRSIFLHHRRRPAPTPRRCSPARDTACQEHALGRDGRGRSKPRAGARSVGMAVGCHAAAAAPCGGSRRLRVPGSSPSPAPRPAPARGLRGAGQRAGFRGFSRPYADGARCPTPAGDAGVAVSRRPGEPATRRWRCATQGQGGPAGGQSGSREGPARRRLVGTHWS